MDGDGGGPLVSDSENKLGKQVLVHFICVMAVVDPLLSDLLLHLCLAVQGRQHSVDSC
jgi:hypothetical protein